MNVRSWRGFVNAVAKLGPRWAFRGQDTDWPLATRLDRALRDHNVSRAMKPQFEEQLIDDFRRRYEGPDLEQVLADRLYCLALMQHYGAPTRLLDFTYSPFVALYFALEKVGDDPVVWGVNLDWLDRSAGSVVGRRRVSARNRYDTRNDSSFDAVYRATPPNKVVFGENAYRLNKRLIIQQGLFLCPGDVSSPFEENFKAMPEWERDTSTVKIELHLDSQSRDAALLELIRSNVHRATLFPGLDGFAQSLESRIVLYKKVPGVFRSVRPTPRSSGRK